MYVTSGIAAADGATVEALPQAETIASATTAPAHFNRPGVFINLAPLK
jgi:hypothetical protein